MLNLSDDSKRRYERIIDDEYRKRFPKEAEAEDRAGCCSMVVMLALSPLVIYYLWTANQEQVAELPDNQLVETEVPTVSTSPVPESPTRIKTTENEAVVRLNFDDIGPCAHSVGRSQRLVDQLRSGEHWRDDNVDRHLQVMGDVGYDARYGGLKGLKGTEREVYKKAFRAGYLKEREP